ncbi:hypothetical protein [Wenyingzhuangia sp. 2_MG-2023]|uniref:hypothetical protein n=1 Tax=Wenyingzhuangia sp. 2_MG-2023 TaxID=3062639 RepID=UPI0026E335EF|nr:hypothetical protein [Wenyingzhuangia sp. 2_MG-2023]MDO6739442.1 hypothetical protein [Wenyingzhuangia sp. 2_MG-2023]
MKYIQILISFFLISCHPIFCNWDRGYEKIEKKININKIIGTYKIKNKKINFPNEIKLSKNGKYYISDTINTFFNNRGKWIHFYNNEENIIDLETKVVRFETKGNNYAILFSIGDPDNCEGIIYIKE